MYIWNLWDFFSLHDAAYDAPTFLLSRIIKQTKFSKNRKKTHKYAKRKNNTVKNVKKCGKYLII